MKKLLLLLLYLISIVNLQAKEFITEIGEELTSVFSNVLNGEIIESQNLGKDVYTSEIIVAEYLNHCEVIKELTKPIFSELEFEVIKPWTETTDGILSQYKKLDNLFYFRYNDIIRSFTMLINKDLKEEDKGNNSYSSKEEILAQSQRELIKSNIKVRKRYIELCENLTNAISNQINGKVVDIKIKADNFDGFIQSYDSKSISDIKQTINEIMETIEASELQIWKLDDEGFWTAIYEKIDEIIMILINKNNLILVSSTLPKISDGL